MIKIEVPNAKEGHRKYQLMTVEETQQFHSDLEEGNITGASKGTYFIIHKTTKRLIGKLDIKDNQELVMLPQVRGG